jgi:hypothetical protein
MPGQNALQGILATGLSFLQIMLFDLNQLTIQIPKPLTSRQLGIWGGVCKSSRTPHLVNISRFYRIRLARKNLWRVFLAV